MHFFSTLNAVIQYKMQCNIWPTFSKRKGSIVNIRHIGNKVTHFQTNLGAGTYALLDSRNLARVLHEESQFPVILIRHSRFYIVNPTGDSGSSVERLSFGSVSLVVSSAELPRLWFVPVISVSAH